MRPGRRRSQRRAGMDFPQRNHNHGSEPDFPRNRGQPSRQQYRHPRAKPSYLGETVRVSCGGRAGHMGILGVRLGTPIRATPRRWRTAGCPSVGCIRGASGCWQTAANGDKVDVSGTYSWRCARDCHHDDRGQHRRSRTALAWGQFHSRSIICRSYTLRLVQFPVR